MLSAALSPDVLTGQTQFRRERTFPPDEGGNVCGMPRSTPDGTNEHAGTAGVVGISGGAFERYPGPQWVVPHPS